MKNFFSVFFLAFVFVSCSDPDKSLPEGEGRLQVKGGKIWYRVIGKPGKTPMVMLHGGPGFPSYYLENLFALASDRQLIVYDQLGCGRSDLVKDSSRMNIAAQREDLDALLAHLGVKDYYLYGHSYGTMLAVDHYLNTSHAPKAMILGSACLSTDRWMADADTLMASMDSVYRIPLTRLKSGDSKDTTGLSKAMTVYFSSFYNLRMNAFLDSSIAHNGTALYKHMWGAEEFIADGNLKGKDLTPDLRNIKVPVLYLTGEFDAARPSTVRYYQALTPNARFVLIPNAAHSTMNDNPQADLKAIRDFMASLEAKDK